MHVLTAFSALPGTGKTMLACEIACGHARNQRQVFALDRRPRTAPSCSAGVRTSRLCGLPYPSLSGRFHDHRRAPISGLVRKVVDASTVTPRSRNSTLERVPRVVARHVAGTRDATKLSGFGKTKHGVQCALERPVALAQRHGRGVGEWNQRIA